VLIGQDSETKSRLGELIFSTEEIRDGVDWALWTLGCVRAEFSELGQGVELTGGCGGRKPRFLTWSTRATGRRFWRWNPKPVTAVAGISPFRIPSRLR
jgi:hypothetical protein